MTTRTIALRLGAFVSAASAVIGAAWIYDFATRGGRERREGHVAPDLALGETLAGADQRAPDAFRPDPTAPVPPSERAALEPAILNGGQQSN